MSKLYKPIEEKEPKRWHKYQRSTHFHSQESHKNIKLEAMICRHRTRCRPMQAHACCLSLLSSYELCSVDWGTCILGILHPSGSYTLSTSSQGFSELWGEGLMETSHLRLTVLRTFTFSIMSSCGSLYLFSSLWGSFSDDDYMRHWSVSIAE